MRLPVWLTLGVALLVCLFGLYRIRIAFRSDEEDQRSRERKGLYAMGRRTHFLIGIVYLLTREPAGWRRPVCPVGR